VAFAVASIATMLYVLAWVGSRLLDKWLPAVPGMRYLQNMSHTWHALQLRCHQLLSWPFILLWGGIGYVHVPFFGGAFSFMAIGCREIFRDRQHV
jgi:hypothetical protein